MVSPVDQSVFSSGEDMQNAKNATHYVKLGKETRESSKCNYYHISPRVIIKAIIIMMNWKTKMDSTWLLWKNFDPDFFG